jgi:hypothetical protein
MRFSDMFPSRFLQASDVEEPITATIAGVQLEDMRDGESKPTLSFEGVGKRLILNKTNGSVLCELFGGDTDRWLGEAVTLFATTTDYQGRRVKCVRLRAPQKAGKKAAPQPDPLADLDEEIPF